MKLGFTIKRGGMLERYELETFLALVEELHFGRTAQRLQVSTARVSQTIRKLERQIGAPLFHRTSRRVELSAVGRRLHDEIQPAWAQITAAFQAAVAAGRGVTGTLRVAFVGAAGGQLLHSAAERFRRQMPGCTVQVREAQIVDVLPWLRDRTVDVVFASLPVFDSDLTTGPVLLDEARMLAVPAQHPFARRASVSIEDLADTTVLQFADVPAAYSDERSPARTPTGRLVTRGASARTLNELLAMVGAGLGVFPVGDQARHYYSRPDVAYVPIHDAPPLRWGLIWRTDSATALIHLYSVAAQDAARSAQRAAFGNFGSVVVSDGGPRAGGTG